MVKIIAVFFIANNIIRFDFVNQLNSNKGDYSLKIIKKKENLNTKDL